MRVRRPHGYEIRDSARRALVKAGRRTSEARLSTVRSSLSYLELGRWLADLPPEDRPTEVGTAFDVFATALAQARPGRFLYLEFGVFEGNSLRWWTSHVRDERARFVGFDSFEGLPEAWRPGMPVGAFATQGPPELGDQRVSFEVGWFEETLRDFLPPDHDQLMINIDGDLYSSAKTVLTWAQPYLVPGTLVYFDEFVDRDHEMRAYFEFTSSANVSLRPVSLSRNGQNFLTVVQ